ncbi:hypothetical protein GOBAR_AA40348 [Gossypium barbadense]|uniref:Uncharacterized protein n=1 Tax=Gossypium barbadense TaxID=3634 RepID=A0A2P5VNG0_GOSBA|nr:hypothetical protein GOBAR_AA40348 [Gossypium barbadense]
MLLVVPSPFIDSSLKSLKNICTADSRHASKNQDKVSDQPRPPPFPNQPPQKTSLETIVEKLAISQEKFQTQTQSHLQEIDKQISQLAQTIGRLESQGRLPSQTETNPRENVSAITLRSGTVISLELTKEPEKIEKDKEDTSLKSQDEKSSPTSVGRKDRPVAFRLPMNTLSGGPLRKDEIRNDSR